MQAPTYLLPIHTPAAHRPMWTLGATLNDFTLGRATAATFATFVVSAALGAAIRYRRHRHLSFRSRATWRAAQR